MMIIQTSYSSSLMFQSDCLPSQVGPPLLSLHSAPDKATDVSLRRQHPPFEDVWDPWPSMCQGSYSAWGWPLTLVRTPPLPCGPAAWRRIPGPTLHPLQQKCPTNSHNSCKPTYLAGHCGLTHQLSWAYIPLQRNRRSLIRRQLFSKQVKTNLF